MIKHKVMKHVTNVHKTEHRRIEEYYAKGFALGNPRGTFRFTMEQLRNQGMVGVWREEHKNLLPEELFEI